MPGRARLPYARVTLGVIALAVRVLTAATQSIPGSGSATTGGNWGLDRIDQINQADGLDHSFVYTADGQGVNIYIIGTGVNRQHDDFKDDAGHSRVTYVGDFCTGATPRTTSAEVDAGDGYYGHDTHVASYAAGNTSGVAKKAQIYSLRTTWNAADPAGANGGRYCSAGGAVPFAIDWIRLHGHASHGSGPAVINYSGGGSGSTTEQTAVANAIDAGYFFTFSGGTGANVETMWGDCASHPNCIANRSLVVGGTYSNDAPLVSPSLYGAYLGMFAPAAGLYGAQKDVTTGYPIPETAPLAIGPGDSFAAPFVAGVAATYLQNHPNASPATVRAALVAAGQAVTGLTKPFVYSRLPVAPADFNADMNGAVQTSAAFIIPSVDPSWHIVAPK